MDLANGIHAHEFSRNDDSTLCEVEEILEQSFNEDDNRERGARGRKQLKNGDFLGESLFQKTASYVIRVGGRVKRELETVLTTRQTHGGVQYVACVWREGRRGKREDGGSEAVTTLCDTCA
ncbi:hypothetical protein V1478_006696 [Vespula squamosa]|uniref:Uncharacterized protein n=1 Tax=Vespula squamosa TaxID=30214 RepID=A0ABD2B0N3_VESSQ